EARYDVSPLAPADDAIELDVDLGHGASRGVIGLEAAHHDLQNVIRGKRTRRILHRLPRARGSQGLDRESLDESGHGCRPAAPRIKAHAPVRLHQHDTRRVEPWLRLRMPDAH